MKRIRILAIKVALMLIFFCNSTAIVAAINKCDSLQMPACNLNGNTIFYPRLKMDII